MTVLAVLVGGVASVPRGLEHVRKERAATVLREQREVVLARAHQGPAAQVLQAAAERALAAGSADVRVAYDNIDLHTNINPEYDATARDGRAVWSRTQDTMAMPKTSRWRVGDRVYAGPAGTGWGPAAYDDTYHPELEWEHSKTVNVSVPLHLNLLLAAGNTRRLGQERVDGRLTMRYVAFVWPRDADGFLKKTLPHLALNPGIYDFPPHSPRAHAQIRLDAWLDEHGQLIRLHHWFPSDDITISFRSYGGPPVTLPQGARLIR
ncbi:hypothetical protein ACIQUQ_27965 [Streptomyces sp. NPDC101118]|uniref:hypothetical protein n=1 Tax=Streptomyces sp. NPDC101118 TaxID=3366109 RepID=UPI00382C5B7B